MSCSLYCRKCSKKHDVSVVRIFSIIYACHVSYTVYDVSRHMMCVSCKDIQHTCHVSYTVENVPRHMMCQLEGNYVGTYHICVSGNMSGNFTII